VEFVHKSFNSPQIPYCHFFRLRLGKHTVLNRLALLQDRILPIGTGATCRMEPANAAFVEEVP